MAARESLDPSRNSNMSDGLHNLLTGLTVHSPGSSSPINTTATATLSPSAAATIEQTLFNTPNRSIFTSGPPTSSVSVSTAQASLSGAVTTNSSRPLSSLTGTSSNTSRARGATSGYHDAASSGRLAGASLHRAEKDIDDPTSAMDANNSSYLSPSTTPMALTRLFAGTAAAGPSRQPSYNSSAEYSRAFMETASLPEHLYNRGFRDGRHSDITVHVFSTPYALHRLILDRSPFFASALSGPWYESSAKEISLHPEEIDPNITQTAFELAMKRLYGAARSEEEKPHATNLLATACWLEMTDLVDTSVEFLMQQMSPARLSEVIDLVGNNYYGKAGERLLCTAKAMLARDGWQMPLKCWDGISGVLIRQTVGSDGFFVPGEWERWILAKRLYNRRLKITAIEHGLYGSNGSSRAPTAAGGLGSSSSSVGPGSPREELNSIKQLYTQTDVVHLMGLVEQGIHYVHMSFEQLQYVRGQVDVLGRPFVRLQTILKAFWMATELRQRVVNSPESSVELGLKQDIQDPPDMSATETEASVTMARRTSADSDTSQVSDSTRTQISSSYAAASRHGYCRKFWIPSADSTRVVGDRAELSLREAANVSSARDVAQAQPSRRGDASDPFLTHLHDSDRTAGLSSRPLAHGTTSPPPPPEKPPHKHFSIFPPFRFSVEFVSPRVMKDKKRVYSQTVWYAGSMWNVYIQKVQSTKNVQLGVYLHRVRERDGEDMMGVATGPRSVDEAIGHLEREMLMRRQARRVRTNNLGDPYLDHGDASGHSGGGDGAAIGSYRAGPSGGGSSSSRKAAQKTALAGGGKSELGLYGLGITGDDLESDDDMDDEASLLTRRLAAGNPAVPPYVDGRPTIRTYFKIYQMSPEGKTLSVHKSAPDVFNFSQSWGWKSVMDESVLGHSNSSGVNTHSLPETDAPLSSSSAAAAAAAAGIAGMTSHAGALPLRNERLRFSIVLGNV